MVIGKVAKKLLPFFFERVHGLPQRNVELRSSLPHKGGRSGRRFASWACGEGEEARALARSKGEKAGSQEGSWYRWSRCEVQLQGDS